MLFTPGSLETPFIDTFLAAGGLKRDEVDLQSVDAAAKLGTYIAGRSDGVFTSIPNAVPLAQKMRPSMAIRFADHGLAMPSFGLVASETMIASKPDALKRFASVVTGAWTAIVGGMQDEAVAAIQKARPEMRMSNEVLRGQIDTMATFFHTPATKGMPLGMMADADWDEASVNLAKAQLIPATAPGASYYTNAMLDPALIAQTASGTA
jgi:NitT/TauT family transport system substrate-binding protein